MANVANFNANENIQDPHIPYPSPMPSTTTGLDNIGMLDLCFGVRTGSSGAGTGSGQIFPQMQQ